MKTLRSIPLLLVVLIMWSCSKDDDPKTPLDEAVGTYNYTSQAYVLVGTSLQTLGSDFSDKGTFILEKDANGFEVKEDGGIQFQGTKIAMASNGFAFDIESQSITSDGSTLQIEGFDNVTLTISGTPTKYNGGYFSPDKRLEAWFKSDVLDPDTGISFVLVISIIGIKV